MHSCVDSDLASACPYTRRITATPLQLPSRHHTLFNRSGPITRRNFRSFDKFVFAHLYIYYHILIYYYHSHIQSLCTLLCINRDEAHTHHQHYAPATPSRCPCLRQLAWKITNVVHSKGYDIALNIITLVECVCVFALIVGGSGEWIRVT